jgi:hypothetical protein
MQQKAKAEIEAHKVENYSEEEMGIAQDEEVGEDDSQEIKYLNKFDEKKHKTLNKDEYEEEFEESPR